MAELKGLLDFYDPMEVALQKEALDTSRQNREFGSMRNRVLYDAMVRESEEKKGALRLQDIMGQLQMTGSSPGSPSPQQQGQGGPQAALPLAPMSGNGGSALDRFEEGTESKSTGAMGFAQSGGPTASPGAGGGMQGGGAMGALRGLPDLTSEMARKYGMTGRDVYGYNQARDAQQAAVTEQMKKEASIMQEVVKATGIEGLRANWQVVAPQLKYFGKLDPSKLRQFADGLIAHPVLGPDGKQIGDMWGTVDPTTGKSKTFNSKEHLPAKAGDEYRSLVAKQERGEPISTDERAKIKAYEREKQLGPRAYGEERAKIQDENLLPVYNPEGNVIGYKTKSQIKQEGFGANTPAVQGVASSKANATMKELRGATSMVKQAVDNLDKDFTTDQMAQLSYVLSLDAPDARTGAWSNFKKGMVGKTLSKPQMEYVNRLYNLHESAMALRQVLGAGQGSDLLRRAIEAVVPGPSTYSKAQAHDALNLFENQIDVLWSAVPSNISSKAGKKVGSVEAQKTTTPAYATVVTGAGEKLVYDNKEAYDAAVKAGGISKADRTEFGQPLSAADRSKAITALRSHGRKVDEDTIRATVEYFRKGGK